MTTGKRLTVKQVLAAYKKSRLTPIDQEWFANGGACPIGALYACNHPTFDSTEFVDDDVQAWADMRFGKYYRRGFLDGFDDRGKMPPCVVGDDHPHLIRYLEGWEDGDAARKATNLN